MNWKLEKVADDFTRSGVVIGAGRSGGARIKHLFPESWPHHTTTTTTTTTGAGRYDKSPNAPIISLSKLFIKLTTVQKQHIGRPSGHANSHVMENVIGVPHG
jgi:hypothetical protein